jgi:TetR/AcrR family transcriptional regulator
VSEEPVIGAAPESHVDAVRDFRRARVLAAAREVFSDKGLQGGSVRAIASAAGCTTGAIYSQFSGKEELYAEVLSEALAGLQHAVSAAAEEEEGPLGLRRAIEAFFTHYRERPSEIGLGLYLFQGVRPMGLGRELDARLNAQLRRVLDVFTAEMEKLGPATDPELETASLFSFLMGLLIIDQTRRVRVTHRDTEELLEHYVEALLARVTPASA